MPSLRSLFLLLLLGAASVALGMRIREELRYPAEMLAPPDLDGVVSDQTLEIPEMPRYEPPAMERFAATLARPLFNTDRRPSEDQPVAVAPVEVQALSATLQGILFSNLEGVALLSPIGEETVVRVSKGDLFLGWRLVEIHPDSAVFERDGEAVTLELIYRTQSAPPERARQRP